MDDLTVGVLREIRDAVRATNERLDLLGGRVDQTNGRLDRLERRQLETEVRLATELTAVVGAIRDLKEAVVADRDLRRDVADHEQRLQKLEARRA